MLEVAVYTKQSDHFCSNVHTKCKNGKVIGEVSTNHSQILGYVGL